MTDLERAAPAYIFVNDDAVAWIARFDPSLQGEVAGLRSRFERRYRVVRKDAAGRWYLRRDLPVVRQPMSSEQAHEAPNGRGALRSTAQ